MKYLIILLLISCTQDPSDKEKALKFSKHFCSCKDGIYFISFKDDEFILECNVGSEKKFYYETKYYGKVCK